MAEGDVPVLLTPENIAKVEEAVASGLDLIAHLLVTLCHTNTIAFKDATAWLNRPK